MRILVFNAGSSSLKFGVFDTDARRETETEVFRGAFDRFTPDGCDFAFRSDADAQKGRAPHTSLGAAIRAVADVLRAQGIGAIDAVGHRIAHGGAEFAQATLLDTPTLARVATLTPLAPLHNPANLEAVAVARAVWPDLPQVGVFDTSFHLSNPAQATTYAVPEAWRRAGLRRFGFHGTSHKYVADRAARALGCALRDLRVISLHLGNGASACAVAFGQSLDSSMGMTPLEGLVMGTRSGDVDPGAFGYLHRELGLDIPAIEAALYSESGLRGLTGSHDMRDIETRAAAGDPDAQLAIDIFAWRARKYVGAYAAAMGGVDALVFTGGVGENSAAMRRRICDGLGFMGLVLDTDRNAAVRLEDDAAPLISAHGSRVAVLVTQTAEQRMIARETAGLLATAPPVAATIPVAVSARHVHLSAEAVAALFGPGATLTPAKPLRQSGHWAAAERIAIEGPRGRLENVAILAPLRARVQIEVSRTDAFALGLEVPVRDSGQLADTPRVTLIGPAGRFETDGLIIAARHIHTNPADAAAMGLHDGQIVAIRVGSADRGLTFARTLVRVADGAFTEMHIDTDEANAAGISAGSEGALITGDGAATILPGA